MVNEFQKAAVSTTLEIPMIYVIDAVHGHSTVHNMTVFPHNIGLGAARDPDLVRRIGAALLPQPLKSEQQGSITLLFPASQFAEIQDGAVVMRVTVRIIGLSMR